MSGRRCAGRRAASGRFPARIDHSQPRTPRALFSPDLCNARTCATPSLQAVSSLLYRSEEEPRTTNFNDRPNVHPRPFFTLCSPSALPNLSISDYPVLLSRAFLLFFSADTNNNGSRRVRAKVLRDGERSTRILLFLFFNDRRGRSIGEFSREKVERDGTMGGDGNPRLRPFSSGERERRGEGEGERVARSTPIGRRRHPSPISEDQRFLNPVARVCVAS